MAVESNLIHKSDFNVLIVDDKKENLLALESLLADQPCHVLKATSGQDALAMLLDHEIFLILLDVQMPEMDGFETAELIRQNRRTKNIPIIFITAIGRDQDFIFKGYQSGAVDYLLKPINDEILKKKVSIFYELYQQKKLLAEKNAELKRMFYIASHDLRSPLINIQGFSRELQVNFETIKQLLQPVGLSGELKRQLDEIITGEIPVALEYIVSSVKSMDTLLNGLLKISRIGEVVINKQALDVNGIIQKIIDNIQYQIKDKHLRVHKEPLPDCLGDNALVTQVFTNLISNAVKYSRNDVEGLIEISGLQSNKYVIYCIEDNGIGIPEEEQPRIFDLFHRVNPQSEIEGEGIGLTAVKLIIERHNGKIWFDSAPGEGTNFYIALPAVTDN